LVGWFVGWLVGWLVYGVRQYLSYIVAMWLSVLLVEETGVLGYTLHGIRTHAVGALHYRFL
jgi:hypothetical protein